MNMASRQEAYQSARFSPETVRQFRSMAIVLAVSFVCTVVSMVTWFREDASTNLPTLNTAYQVQMDLLKDPNGVHGGDNWLAGCDQTVFCDQTFLVEDGVTQAVATIANVGAGNTAFHYRLTVSEVHGNKQKPVFQAKDSSPVKPGGAGVTHEIPLTPGTTVRVQLYTAAEGMTIHTASNGEQLLRPYSGNLHQIYLTNDIALEDLCFDQGYPNLHLAGYTLSAQSMEVKTRKGDFGRMLIQNGRLVIGGTALTEQDAVIPVGEGQVTVSLQNLVS